MMISTPSIDKGSTSSKKLQNACRDVRRQWSPSELRRRRDQAAAKQFELCQMLVLRDFALGCQR